MLRHGRKGMKREPFGCTGGSVYIEKLEHDGCAECRAIMNTLKLWVQLGHMVGKSGEYAG